MVDTYDGDLAGFNTKAARFCDNVSEQSLFFILKGIKNSCSGGLLAHAERILTDEELDKMKKKLSKFELINDSKDY